MMPCLEHHNVWQIILLSALTDQDISELAAVLLESFDPFKHVVTPATLISPYAGPPGNRMYHEINCYLWSMLGLKRASVESYVCSHFER